MTLTGNDAVDFFESMQHQTKGSRKYYLRLKAI